MLATMQRHSAPNAHNPYARPVSLTARNQSTSSAFSPSAHPHEDWTKITDLAERRRIQNRIAQRNYRKKLKKRFEDLERRAATSGSEKSSSSSSSRKKDAKKSKPRTSLSGVTLQHQASAYAPIPISEPPQIGFLSLPEDPMFLDQFPKTMSLSPPPNYAYPTATMDTFSFSPYSTSLPVSAITAHAVEAPSYGYQHPLPSPFPSPVQTCELAVKPEVYQEVGMGSFNMSFAPIPNVEVTAGQYGDQMPQTPPLSDSFESSCPTPEESFFGYTTIPSPSMAARLL